MSYTRLPQSDAGELQGVPVATTQPAHGQSPSYNESTGQYEPNNTMKGPASNSDNAVPRFDGANSPILQSSPITVDDAGNMEGVRNLTVEILTAGETVTVADNIIVLNSDVTGTPSVDGGIEIQRGTSPNATIKWDEGTDKWQAGVLGAVEDISLASHNHDAAYEAKNSNIQSHIGNSSNPHSVTKSQVGLGNVDNTSDANKPISTATQTALDGKSATSHNHTGTYEPANSNIQSHISSGANPHSTTAAQVGLGNVDNTSDANKPISTATQTALDGKSATSHNHTGTYEAANSNIQSHISNTTSAHGLTIANVLTTSYAGVGLVEEFCGHIETAANKTYYLDFKAAYAYTINVLDIACASGTCTVAVKIGGTSVTSISAVSVSSTPTTATASGGNSVSAGGQVTFVISANSAALDVVFTLKVTRA